MALPVLSLFMVSLGYGVIVPLLPELSGGAASVTPGVMSLVYATYAAAKIGIQVPAGVWADRVGGTKVLRVAMPLFALSLAGFLWNGGSAWFALVRSVEGAATGLVYPAVFALVAQRGVEGQGKRIGLTVGLGSSGLLLGPALGWVLAPVDVRAPIWAALAVAVALSVWLFVAPPPSKGAVSPRTLKGELELIGRLAGSVVFIGLMLPIAFNKLTFTAFQGLIPLHLPNVLHLGTREVVALFAMTGVLFGVFQGVGGALADRFAPRAVAIVFSVPLLVALALLWRAGTGVEFAAAYGSYVCCSSVIFTATLKHAARAFGTEDTYGGVFGVLATLTDLMTVVGPLLFLGVYGALGSSVFLLMTAIGVPAAIAYAFLSRSQTPRFG
ncbi:MAG: MFS transporter [Myxococcaceae bacterium]|nr:MFS transporter [Myxococcaceae bacterium]